MQRLRLRADTGVLVEKPAARGGSWWPSRTSGIGVRHVSFIKKHTAGLTAILALCDGACIVVAGAISMAATLQADWALPDQLSEKALWIVVLLVAWYVQALDHRLYLSRRSDALVPQLLAVSKAGFIALLMAIFFMAIYNRQGLDRSFVLVFCYIAFMLVLALRLVARLGLLGLRGRGYNYRIIVIVGANPRAAKLTEVLLSHEQYGYHIEGFLDDDSERQHFLEGYEIPYLGKIEELERLLVESVVDLVYVTLPVRTHYETVRNIAHLCEGVGVSVRLIGDFFPLQAATSELIHVGDVPLLSLSTPGIESRFDLRRLSETAESTLLLIALFPLLLMIALLVKLDSKGPVLVREPRVSARTGRRFDMLSFRTAPGPEAGAEEGTGTRFGRFLRWYSLDELPQIINVVLGHMSTGGPPPQVPSGAAIEQNA